VRPVALRLQAFGSYAGEFGIDFARLGRHGVFSITGPTGAGKSTIFDAIVYALYDDLPGFRVNSHVRSQYAEPGTRTEVTLEFEAEGRHWVLTRSPAQARPKVRGTSGVVEDPSKVVLAEAGGGGAVWTKKREVAERLTELVGLDKAQFEQVVLIPQGRFEEVLKARTQERADLLAKLFPVDVYIRTTEALRQRAADRRDAYDELASGRRSAEDRIRTDVAAFHASARTVGPVDVRTPEPDATPPDDDGPPLPVPEDPDGPTPVDVDLTRLPELRDRMATILTSVTADRDTAATRYEEARVARVEVEAAVQRWEQWQKDRAEVRTHPVEEAADAEVVLALERAATVATLSTSVAAWRAATEQLAGLDVERRSLLVAVDAGWVDGADRSALDSAMSAHLLAAAIGSDAAALEAADHRYLELGRRQVELEDDERGQAVRTVRLAEAVTALDLLGARVAAAEAASADGAVLTASRPGAVARIEQLEHDASAVRARTTASRDVADQADGLAAARRQLAGAEERVTALRTAWRSGLAGRLAAHLEDGAPCPTCGATEHPSPAVTTVDTPTDDVLEAAEEEFRLRSGAVHDAEMRVAAAQAGLDALAPVAGGADAEERLETARSDLAAIDAAIAEHAVRTAELDQLRAEATAASAHVGAERSSLDGLSGTLVERRARWQADSDAFVAEFGTLASTGTAASARRKLAEAVAALAGNLEATAAATAARAEHRAAMAPTLESFGIDEPVGLERWSMTVDDVRTAQAGLDQRAERRREVVTRIDDYAAADGPDRAPEVAPSLQAEREAAEVHTDLVGRVASMSDRLAAVDAARTALDDGAGAVADALRAKEEADTLAGLCAGLGNGPDASRLSLKNWVLAYYLRQVLAHANRRLDTMTNGRYALALSEEHADGRRPWGLDISVRDAETGQSRPATTLSGGETFMAALALALGLADVVSAGSNYSIGALFVDEGFGSLDGDSLDTVIDVLRSLQDGGRMVGVISHVQELKDALPNGITIASTNHGSVATIHYPDAWA
jgi:exonuclease SbcC